MKVDLELLSAHLARLEENSSIPRDGVNAYLLDKILFPSMNGERVRLDEIDFSAFEAEDVGDLAEFYDKLSSRAYAVEQLAKNMDEIHPVPANFRAFC